MKLFGVNFSKRDKGSDLLCVIDVEVKSTRPNLWGRFKYLVLLGKHGLLKRFIARKGDEHEK